MKRCGYFLFFLFLLLVSLGGHENNQNHNIYDLSKDVIQLLSQCKITHPQNEFVEYIENNSISKIENGDCSTIEKKEIAEIDKNYSHNYQQLIEILQKNDARSIETVNRFTHKKIAIIGRLTDTERYRKCLFCDVLSDKGWTKDINIQWLQNIVSRRQWVYVVSPLKTQNIFIMDDHNNNVTFFAVELGFLIKSGYKLLGNWLVPIKPYEPIPMTTSFFSEVLAEGKNQHIAGGEKLSLR